MQLEKGGRPSLVSRTSVISIKRRYEYRNKNDTRYPKVIMTHEELQSILTLIRVEYEWNKNADEDYPKLSSATKKLELFEDKP